MHRISYRAALVAPIALIAVPAGAAPVSSAGRNDLSAPPAAVVQTSSPVVPVLPYPPMQRAPAQRTAAPVRPVQVIMALGQTLLWRGTLHIGGGQQARISLSEPVPGAQGCGGPDARAASRMIELSISNMRGGQQGEGYTLSARYVRPPADGTCVGGTRTVSMEQRFELDGGRTLVFEGDGGLKVTIARD